MFLIALLIILIIISLILFIPLKCNSECFINKSNDFQGYHQKKTPNYLQHFSNKHILS